LRFFKSRGVPEAHLSDLQRPVDTSRDAISKYEIVRIVLDRINRQGDAYLSIRREVLRRVVEWEDFSTSWPNEAVQAQGFVSKVRQMVDTKDSFTRMRQERDNERAKRLRPQREATAAMEQKREQRRALLSEVWSHIKRGLGNLLVWGVDELVAVVKNWLKRVQYRPELLDAFLAHTGLGLEPL
jgi:hypothetical protein